MRDDTEDSILADVEPRPKNMAHALRLILNPLAFFVLITVAFLVILISQRPSKKKPTGNTVLVSAPTDGPADSGTLTTPREPAVVARAASPSVGNIPTPDREKRPATSKKSTQSDEARKQRITILSNEIYENLQKEGDVTPDTIVLKSGEKINCTLLNNLGTHWKINYRGMITIVDKKKVESVRSRSPQSVEMELRKMALEQATKIVDEGLVRYEGDWITPEERNLRIHIAETEADIREIEAKERVGVPAPDVENPATPKAKPPTNTADNDSSKITVAGGFGFDDIVVGDPRCTREFIVSRLGPPETEKPHVLDYDGRLGMRFIMAIDADMLVEIHLSRRFAGKVLPGISMSSSLEDIFEAYGQPVEEETAESIHEPYYKYRNRTLYRVDDLGRLAYRDLGLLFSFTDDRISQIVIHGT